MVDAVVSFAIERLGDYLIKEAGGLLHGVKDEVVSLKKDLEWMNSFIQDAERKQADKEMIRRWVNDIRDIAYDTENVLDKYKLKFPDEGTSKTTRVLSFIKGGNIAKEIKALRSRLNDVSHRRQAFGLENINNIWEEENHALGKLRQIRRTTSFERTEINVVGYEDDTNKLLVKLLDKNEPRRSVISIFGTGGLGKTTLARKLYHNNDVKNKFIHRSWVYVSQEYNPQDLLMRIIKSFRIGDLKQIENMGEEDLERHLHQSLQGYSYLVVIDDVWDTEAWKSLKRAFPDDNNGSRVVITTRNKDVAEHSDGNTYAHALRFLRPDESLKLFCEKAFANSIVDERLEKLVKEMVQKCGGLPLAIVVLGGLLYKKNLQAWHRVHKQIWRDLSKDVEISYLLALSFDDLPYQLKACFLYLGHFPEDYAIEREKVIRLWVAEGFIPQKEVMEDVGNEYLNELINRSLIQIDRMNWGRIETCRLHDLLRDLAVKKAEELNFIHIYDELRNSTHCSASCRRQVYSLREKNLWLQQGNPLFRSLLFFEDRYHHELSTVTKDLPTVCKSFKLLRVLDLENCYIGESKVFSERIGKLIHLKYLGLKNTNVKCLPPTIGNLLSLQTLDVYHEKCFFDLPFEILLLKELRHLIGQFTSIIPVRKFRRSSLATGIYPAKLQTLKFLRGDIWISMDRSMLENLRELSISEFMNFEPKDEFTADTDSRVNEPQEELTTASRVHEARKEFTFDSIAKLKSLQILSVSLSSKIYHFASLRPLCLCQNLLHLTLIGKIENLPGNLNEILPNLECLSLWESDLVDDPMPTLEKLQSLMNLDLGLNSYGGKKMICSANGFPRLETLLLNGLKLEEWQVEEGAMPMLSGLKIDQMNPKLTIPERLRSFPLPIYQFFG